MKGFKPEGLKGAKVDRAVGGWENVGGLEKVKTRLKEVFENPVRYKRIFDNSPIKQPKGGILYGPTGCGKTLIGSSIASACGLNFISVKGPEILDKYIGASEAAIRDVFKRAEIASPCLVFFDEFESVGGKRGKVRGEHAMSMRLAKRIAKAIGT